MPGEGELTLEPKLEENVGIFLISSTVCALCPAGQESPLWGLREASTAELFA